MEFKTHDVKGDGNCFYYSIQSLLNHAKIFLCDDNNNPACLRTLIADNLKNNKPYIKELVKMIDGDVHSDFIEPESAFALICKKYPNILNESISTIISRLKQVIVTTKCYITEMEFMIMRKMLLSTYRIYLLPITDENMKKSNARALVSLVKHIKKEDATKVMLVRSDGCHYNWITIDGLSFINTRIFLKKLQKMIDNDKSKNKSRSDNSQSAPKKPRISRKKLCIIADQLGLHVPSKSTVGDIVAIISDFLIDLSVGFAHNKPNAKAHTSLGARV